MIVDFLKLARPAQWSKSAFVLVGPLYALAGGTEVDWVGVTVVTIAFSLVASAGYVLNDIRDRELDLAHPRKRHRPIASGRIPPRSAAVFAVALMAAAGGLILGWAWQTHGTANDGRWIWPAAMVGLYWANVTAYSHWLKHRVVADVISLALGFVVRVLAGCAAGGIEPSPWLVNSTFFISMFLAFSKRLGERRTMGSADAAGTARTVQFKYTDDILRMLVVVTAVATLLTYAGYVQSFELRADRASPTGPSFGVLWMTMLPATYGLLRCIVLVERGDYDDPTELASRDIPFQVAAVVFALFTIAAWSAPRLA
ncbi:MAG: UbiA family prenyltransferase [Phycisphaeraceae bacterium]|nr:UbiA family prenyltransferase [Phycisphaerae bacterium]MBX3393105.1 UbiA family prenyltransferase [Phycisphaeraceae bacterium]